MRCPDCQNEIPDGSTVCPSCQAVLEAEIVESSVDDLWDQPSAAEIMTSARGTSEVDAAVARRAVARAQARRSPSSRSSAATPAPPPRGAPPASPPPARGRRPTSGSTGPHPRIAPPPTGPVPSLDPAPVPEAPPPAPPAGRSFGPASQAVIPTHIVTADPEKGRGTQIVDLSLPPVVRQMAASKKQKEREEARAEKAKTAGKPGATIGVEESKVTQGIDEVMASIRLFYARMHRIDRWTFFAIVVAFVGAFLPWRVLRGEGLIAGIQEYGAGSAALSVLAFLCIYARTMRRRLTGLLIAAQLLVAVGLVAVPTLRFLLAGAESELSLGVYLSAAGGVAVVVMTLMRLARLNA